MQGLKSKLMFTLLGITETCSFIQRLNSYILLIDKVTEKVPWTNFRLDKNAKKISESWKWTIHKGQY